MILDRLTVVVPDGLGTREVPSFVFDWPVGSDVTMRFRLVHSDGSAYDLSGSVAAILSFKKRSSDVLPVLSREFVVTNPSAGEFEFHVSRNDRDKLVVGRFAVGMVFEDDDTETIDFVMVDSTLTVTDPIASVDDPITVLPSDTPLAQGPRGTAGGVFWSLSKTWADVYAEYVLGGTFGDIWVESDPSFAPRQIPAGQYDLVDANFIGLVDGVTEGPIIDFADGALIDQGGRSSLRGSYVEFKFHNKLVADGSSVYVQLYFSFLERAVGYTGAAFAAVPTANLNLNWSGLLNEDSGIVPTAGIFEFVDGATAGIALLDASLSKGSFSGTATNSVFIAVAGAEAIQSLRVPGIYVSPFAPLFAGSASFILPPYATVDLPGMPDPGLAGSVAWDLTVGKIKVSDGNGWDLVTNVSVTPVKIAADNYEAKYGDLVRCDPSGGAMSVILPSASSSEKTITVKNVTASANGITISPQSGETVDGAPDLVLSASRSSATFVSDGATDWMQIATA